MSKSEFIWTRFWLQYLSKPGAKTNEYGFRDVLIRGESSDGKVSGESKSQTRVGGITLALGGSLVSIQGQRDWMLLDRR